MAYNFNFIFYLELLHPRHRCFPLHTEWDGSVLVSWWGFWLAQSPWSWGIPISRGVWMRFLLQTAAQSPVAPDGVRVMVKHGHTYTSFLNTCSWDIHCKSVFTRPLVSRNLLKTVSTVLDFSGSWIISCLCWKVSLIFWKIWSSSVLCVSREMASRTWSPSSWRSSATATVLSSCGPLRPVVLESLLCLGPWLLSFWVFLILQAM